MAERQSAPDELATSEGGINGSQPAPPPVGDRATEAQDRGGDPAELVAEQLAATPSAAQPGPVEPGDAAPTGEETVVTGPIAGRIAAPAPPSAWFRPMDNASTQTISRLPGPDPAPAQPGLHRANGRDTTTAQQAAETSRPAGYRTHVPSPSAQSAGAVPGDRAGQSAGRSTADYPTEVFPPVFSAPAPPAAAPGSAPPPQRPAGPDGAPAPWRRPLLVAAAVLGLLALLYVVDLVVSLGAVPRGVTVAGVSVGGLDYAAAESRLRAEIEPRTTRPVDVTVGQVRSELDPRAAGLQINWDATLDQAGSQPLNPFTRISSFFSEREVGVVTDTDMQALIGALEQLAPVVDRAPVEGTVAFEGGAPVPVDPVPGQRLEVAAAADVLQRDWANGAVAALPLTPLPPTTTPADVRTAIDKIARPAVSAPVIVLGEGGTQGTITPELTAQTLSFRAEAGRGLIPELNQLAIADALDPQLAASETPGRDASINFSSGTPVIVPSQDGRGIDYEVTLKDLLRVLTGTGARQITAVYAEQPAELTTEEVTGLGITGLVSEFQTGGFAADSGLNIKRAAEQINGMILQPGETFSLNGATEPRNAASGYVEAGIINDGHPSRGVGGGVSQVATTLYNAAYFAGMVDVTHKEHSFYISRYPAGREATVYEGAIDLRFRNDNPTGVLIQTAWTPTSLTIRMYGTKRYEVTSTPGPRTNPTNPNTVTIPKGQPCNPSQGAPGFTITDTRTLREISTGQSRSETRTVRYNPSPIVVCGQ